MFQMQKARSHNEKLPYVNGLNIRIIYQHHNIVTKSCDESEIFRNLAYQIHELKNRADVTFIFDVL